jgi:cytosine/adenosine deaminase-related metal-dependent hydrolase
MAGLPDAMKDWLSKPGNSPYCKDGPATVDLMHRLRNDYRDTSLVQLCYGPAGPQWVSDAMWKLLANDANANGIGMHMHAMESPAQRDAAKELFPEGAFQHLKKLGALNERSVLAHAVWVSDADIALLAESGASVVRNPGCNIRMRNGIAPLARYLAAGVPVAIGTDNCSMQDDEDLLSELRLAGALGREPDWNELPPPSVEDMLAIATTFGAKAAQFEGEIGQLDEGMRADIAVFSLASTRHPYLDADMPIMEAFLARGIGSDTLMTMIDGQILYANGQYTQLDITALEQEAAQAAQRARAPADLENINRTKQLRNHLRDHYQSVAADGNTRKRGTDV